MALSPARTRSIKTMAKRADHQGVEKISIYTLQHSHQKKKIHMRISMSNETVQARWDAAAWAANASI
jgi:hypothetical protein